MNWSIYSQLIYYYFSLFLIPINLWFEIWITILNIKYKQWNKWKNIYIFLNYSNKIFLLIIKYLSKLHFYRLIKFFLFELEFIKITFTKSTNEYIMNENNLFWLLFSVCRMPCYQHIDEKSWLRYEIANRKRMHK
jgi:hypothetical protein